MEEVTLSELFTQIADELRVKLETEGKITASDFPNKIAEISKGIDTTDATATAEDILKDKTAYVNGEKVTGTLEAGGGDNNVMANSGLTGVSTTNSTKVSPTFSKSIKKISNIKVVDSGEGLFMNLRGVEEFTNIDTTGVTNMYYMFRDCRCMKKAPILNTSSATTMNQTFADCSVLEDVEYMEIPNLTSANSIFSNCPLLSDKSLNNILLMFANAIKYTETKTLKTLGLTSAQATTCTTLSNYQAFLDARLDYRILEL